MKIRYMAATVLVLAVALLITGNSILLASRSPAVAPEFIQKEPETVADPKVENLVERVEGLRLVIGPTRRLYGIKPVAEQDPAIVQAIDKAAREYGAVGVQVAVIRDGRVADMYAWGWATKDTDPMTVDHKMRVASISKILVGAAAMFAQEDGLIDLDDDVGTYWGVTARNKYYPNTPITLRHLLTHVSSMYQYGDDGAKSYEDVVSRLENGSYIYVRPGSAGAWLYNNHGFRVLGMTVELAANLRLDDILYEKLWKPMNVDASFGCGDIQATDKLVTIYMENGAVGLSVAGQLYRHIPSKPAGDGTHYAGGLTISAADLAKVVELLVNNGVYNGRQLMQAESVAEMEQYMEQKLPGDVYQAQPMLYRPGMYGREGIYYHTGSAFGVYNCFSYDPVTRDGVVVLTTGAKGVKDATDVYEICARINDFIYKTIA